MNPWARSEGRGLPFTVTVGADPLDSEGWEAITYSDEGGPPVVLGRAPIVNGRFYVATPPDWTGHFQVEVVSPDGTHFTAHRGRIIGPA